MTRRADWEDRLHAFLGPITDKPHNYGSHDCLLFVAGAIEAVTGVDHAKGHRGKYKSMAGASRHLRSIGFDKPEAMLDSLFDEKPVGFAQRGDIVLTPDGIPGLCIGSTALVVGMIEDGPEGLIHVPRALWSKAWTV